MVFSRAPPVMSLPLYMMLRGCATVWGSLGVVSSLFGVSVFYWVYFMLGIGNAVGKLVGLFFRLRSPVPPTSLP